MAHTVTPGNSNIKRLVGIKQQENNYFHRQHSLDYRSHIFLQNTNCRNTFHLHHLQNCNALLALRSVQFQSKVILLEINRLEQIKTIIKILDSEHDTLMTRTTNTQCRKIIIA